MCKTRACVNKWSLTINHALLNNGQDMAIKYVMSHKNDGYSFSKKKTLSVLKTKFMYIFIIRQRHVYPCVWIYILTYLHLLPHICISESGKH